MNNIVLNFKNQSIMESISNFELQSLIKLAGDKADRTQNYMQAIGLGLAEDEDKEFMAEQLAELSFYQNLRDKLQRILNAE